MPALPPTQFTQRGPSTYGIDSLPADNPASHYRLNLFRVAVNVDPPPPPNLDPSYKSRKPLVGVNKYQYRGGGSPVPFIISGLAFSSDFRIIHTTPATPPHCTSLHCSSHPLVRSGRHNVFRQMLLTMYCYEPPRTKTKPTLNRNKTSTQQAPLLTGTNGPARVCCPTLKRRGDQHPSKA